MTSLTNSLLLPISPGSSSKSVDRRLASVWPINISFGISAINKKQLSTSMKYLKIQAGYRGDQGSESLSNLLGGFVLGGLVIGTLGSVYAPKIGKALAGTDIKDLTSKLRKFIYNEEKALEKSQGTVKKIEQLNLAMDEVSAQLRSKDVQNGVVVDAEEELDVAAQQINSHIEK